MTGEWDNAIEQAKTEMGHYGYVEPQFWDEVVERAKEILRTEREEIWEEQYKDLCKNYREYLKSDKWKKLRTKILERDKYICWDCDGSATEVHHLDYDYLETDDEEKHCVSLCRICHMQRHGIVNRSAPKPKKKKDITLDHFYDKGGKKIGDVGGGK